MKYCLSSRQKDKVLKLANEIMVQSRDYRQVSDLFVDYPEAIIILEVNNEDIVNEDRRKIIKQYAEASSNFCCCIYNLNYVNWFKESGIKFYYGYPINSFYDVRGLIDLGVEYVKITAPLTFNMNAIEKIGTKFRMVPNIAYDAYIPRENGICGQYVRPEDVKWYENGIYVFEFENVNLSQEEVMFKIYSQKQEWKDDLSILITNFNIESNASAYPETFGEMRSNCRQKCMEATNSCHFCERAVKFDKIIKKYLKEKREQERLNASQD